MSGNDTAVRVGTSPTQPAMHTASAIYISTDAAWMYAFCVRCGQFIAGATALGRIALAAKAHVCQKARLH
jgi:hypothetical protein